MENGTGKNSASGIPALSGGVARYLSNKAQAVRLIYKQLLFVWLSFFLMSVLSYFFISNIMQQHLLEGADTALSHTRSLIASELAESAMMLKGFSQSVRYMILRGESSQVVDDYMKSFSLINSNRKYGVYGWFDAFGAYLNRGAWTPPADYVPQKRPWYIAAVVANGEVGATQPYVDARGRGVVMSYARRIFDDEARPLAVISVDVPLDRIGQYVTDTRLAEGGYGVLLSAQLQIIAHKDASQIGKAFREINSDAAAIADELMRGLDVAERRIITARGDEAIVFFRGIDNGWYLGIVTPIDKYYQGARTMARFLLALAVLLATALSMVLLHIAASKERADARLRAMFEASPLCATFWDRNARIIDCNQEAVKLFAVSSKQEFRDRFFEFAPEYQPCGRLSTEKALAWVQKAFAEGYCRFEWMHQALHGEPIPAEVTLVRIQYQQEVIVAGYVRDLRELKSTMARIAAESARFEATAHWYHSILDAIPLPISVTDADAKWTFVNAAVEKFLGVKRDDAMGKACSNWGAHICNTDDCGIECAKRGVKQTYFAHEGSSYTVDVEILKDLHGNTTGFVEIVQDVTKLEQMAKRQMEVESVSQAKSAFLAVVSHEIRTPMNAILGITEIHLQNEMLSQDTREAFGRIYTAGYTLLGIINDILDLSRMEAGKVELMPAKYEIASLINDTVQLNMVRIGGKPIEFRLQVDEDMPSALFGDELRIKQVLNNLLSNAFKYTQEGEVVLSVSAYVHGHGEESPDVTLVCRVSDTGHGMTEEQVSRLFEEYSRFYLEANRAIEGIGLGMGITRQLVQMMDGVILVDSEPDKGSTFPVWLPQGSVGAGPLGRDKAESLGQFQAGMPHMKVAHIVREPMPYGSVLVVDDLETNLYVTKGLLAPYGLAVDTVLSGFEAIDNVRAGKEYDVVFMDHMMPKMDGVETTRLLRELGYDRPVIALTANAVVGQAEMFLESGFDGFISKPVDLRQLNATLNRLVRDKQPPDVVEAARRQRGGAFIANKGLQPAVDPQLAVIFTRDAEKVVAVLEAMHTNQYRRDDDLHMFVVNVHAMKSALANIGEAELAAFAHKLEQAGRNRETAVMSAETPAFLDLLRAAIVKIRPGQEGGGDEAADEDRAYLREKLSLIQAACVAYDKKAAKGALAELRQKAWSRQTREQLDTIAEHLLHSDFEEAANCAEQTIRTI
jgi:PAS domain S-box-containing protein